MTTRTPRFRFAAPIPRAHSTAPLGHSWRLLRNRKLAQDPLCEVCANDQRVTIATEVDHIVARALQGTHDWSNLQSICRACHAVKTQQDIRNIRRGHA